MDAVLAERFGLKYHIENRRMPVLFLEVDRGGPHYLKPSPSGEQSLDLRLGMKVYGRGVSMDELAAKAGSYFLGRPTLNRTSLNGFYDIDTPAPGGAYMGRDANQSRMMRQLKQMGLKLVSGKADVPVIVVDHVTMPTPN